MGLFDDLFGGGQKAAQDAAAQKIQGLQNAQAYADPLYAQSQNALTSGYGQAQGIFQPGYNIGQGGAQAYADITGAAGQAGQDRARALFQTDPGYQFARDQALQATERQSGTGGGQYSGNVLSALEDRASGLAQQQYGNYVQRLAPFLGYSLGTAGQLGGAYTGEGTALSGNLTDQAKLGYGTQAGIGSAEAAGTLGAAQARTGEINSLLGLGSRLLGYGGGGSLGGLGGTLGAGANNLGAGFGNLFGYTGPAYGPGY
jgi:hypothetical protein